LILPSSNSNASTHTNYLTVLLKSSRYLQGAVTRSAVKTHSAESRLSVWVAALRKTRSRPASIQAEGLCWPVLWARFSCFRGLAEGHRALSERRIIAVRPKRSTPNFIFFPGAGKAAFSRAPAGRRVQKKQGFSAGNKGFPGRSRHPAGRAGPGGTGLPRGPRPGRSGKNLRR
jgi:hypothetical protein